MAHCDNKVANYNRVAYYDNRVAHCDNRLVGLNTQACPLEWDSHGKCPMGWDRTARNAFPMGQYYITELSLSETVDEQEINDLLNENSDSEYECQNDNEL